jgi:hypothetical protein
MDQTRFDNLTRDLASSASSRRGVAKALAGGGLAGLVGLLGLRGAAAEDTAEAAGERKKGKCPTSRKCGKKCCKKTQTCENKKCVDCQDQTVACQGRQCGLAANNCGQLFDCGVCSGGKTCFFNQCICPDDQRECNGACIPNGACCTNNDCAGGGVCQNGACVCPSGKRLCNNTCIPAGDCCGDNECRGDQVCQNGSCLCAGGGNECNGTCISQSACCTDNDCPGNKRCAGGNCLCPSNRPKDCGDVCIPAGNECP